MNTSKKNSLAVITGASTGIGYDLAKCCARDGFNLLIVSHSPKIHEAAAEMQGMGVQVEPMQADLATFEGVDQVYTALQGRFVDALLANAGRGLGKGFLDQAVTDWKNVIDLNIVGTLYLIHKIGRDMRQTGRGRILITGSIAGFMPGTYQAVYNGTKAFLDNFSFALRHELMNFGVTVTCLMPGATETEFFERADLLDTKVGQSEKEDPAAVAQKGFDAMMKGEGDVISGWQNKLRVAIASIAPADLTAEMHRQMAEPGSGSRK